MLCLTGLIGPIKLAESEKGLIGLDRVRTSARAEVCVRAYVRARVCAWYLLMLAVVEAVDTIAALAQLPRSATHPRTHAYKA